jgi:hypothetical protein
MPRTYLTERQRVAARIQKLFTGQMRIMNLKQQNIADVWGVSQQAASYKIRNGNISLTEFIQANRILQFSDGEMLEILKGAEK